MEPSPSNPYAAPLATLSDVKSQSRNSTAIFIGAAIGNGIAYVVLAVLALVFLWVLTSQGVPTSELYLRAYQSVGYLIFAHLTGLLCLLPGGYWTARLSTDRHILNALFAGLLTASLAIILHVTPYVLPIPIWSRVASITIPIPAFLIGAFWWRRTHNSSQ